MPDAPIAWTVIRRPPEGFGTAPYVIAAFLREGGIRLEKLSFDQARQVGLDPIPGVPDPH